MINVFQRGQITLEYLFVTLIIISLLGFSLYALVKIKESADNSITILNFKNDALGIYNAAKDVCALGNGNSRVVSIKTPMNISFEKKNELNFMVFEQGNNTIVKTIECQLYNSFTDLAKGEVVVENKDDEIKLS